MAQDKFNLLIGRFFLAFFFLIKFSFIFSQYLLEDSSIYVDRNDYPNYYINDNKLRKCDHPCYECSSESDESNQNCLSCERGYEFDSETNSCIKCPKNRYKYIYSSYNTCIYSNEDYCKKEITKCTLLTDEEFKECPLDIPIFIESKKMCIDAKICNNKESNEICNQLNIHYKKSRKSNPTYFLNNELLDNKHNIGVTNDKYGNILFEACGDFDEYRYYYGIKKDGNSNFTDEFNKPTYLSIEVDGFSGNLLNKKDFVLLDFDNSLGGGTYFISFFPKNFTFELEGFIIGNSDNNRIKIKNMCEILPYDNQKEIIKNYTLYSTINSFFLNNNPLYQGLNNLFFMAFIGVNDLNEYSLFIAYVTINSFFLTTVTILFTKIEEEQICDFKRVSSCLTDSYRVVVLYLNINYDLKAVIEDSIVIKKVNDKIDDNISNNHYFSCVHLFEETISFIYYKEDKLILLFKNISSTHDSFIDYNEDLKNITINSGYKYPISPLYYNNEAIKINSKKFVIISKYENKQKLLIILFEFYNKDVESVFKSINVRYYEFPLNSNNIEINENFKIFLFKKLLGIYFYNELNLFPGFIIFSFTKLNNSSNDNNIFNAQNKYTIQIKDYITIENNIFGFEPKIKILSLPNITTSGIYFYDSNYNQIYEGDILDITDSISLAYLSSSLVNNFYILKIVTISAEPSLFSIYNFYSDEIEIYGENISQENFYINDIENFECQEASLIFEISEEDSTCDPSCNICNNNQCFSCLDSSKFPAELKKECYSISSPPGDEYYFNDTINIYLLCHSNCDRCNGSYDEFTNEQNCLNCKNSFIKMEGTNNCYPENEILFSYYKSQENIFKRCDKHCETCSTAPSDDGYFNCISCDTEDNYTFFDKSNNCLICFSKNKIADYEQKKCIYENEIKEGYYLNENRIVEKCYQNCKTCSNGEFLEKINNINILNMNCDSCDNDKNYYYKDLKNEQFYNCYLENEIPKNYYKKFDSEKNESKYYECYHLCGECDELGTDNDMKCKSCLNIDDYELIYGNCFKLKKCPYYYIRNITNFHKKECLKENELCIEDYPFIFPSNNECKDKCTFNELISRQCISTNKPKALQEIHNIIIKKLKDKEIFLDDNNNFNDIIIEGIDSFSHLTTNINQNNYELNIEFNNLSNIELGDCEQKLKEKNNLKEDDTLFIFIIEIIRNDTPSREVEYEIYNPYNLSKNLDLSVCKDIPIIINSPILLNESQFMKYKNAKNQGYDIYNPNDIFYEDLCTPFDNENLSDVLIDDRKNDYYDNISLCESNCEYQEINTENRKVKCSCEIKTEMHLKDYFSNIYFEPNKLKEDFFEACKYSNLKVLKCYKLVFNLTKLKTNLGSYFILFLAFLFFISVVYTLFTFNKNIQKIISSILEMMEKLMEINSKSEGKNKKTKKKAKRSKSSRIVFSPTKKRKAKTMRKEKNTNKIIYNDNNIIINNYINKDNINCKDCKDKILNMPIIGRNKIKSKSSKLVLMDSKDTFHSLWNQNKSSNNNTKYIQKINKQKSKFENSKKFKKFKKSNKINNYNNNCDELHIEQLIIKLKPEERYRYFIDAEMNNLLYLHAIENDFRSFLQYYWSLLKEKQLILFTFIDSNDYNIKSIKFSLFICSFSIYFTANTFFFNDDSIHKIYINKGSFDVNFQIIKILFSSGIIIFINLILKQLSLSQKNILKIKQSSNHNYKIESKNVYNCIKTKLLFYIIFGILVLLFTWYYIAAFCCVYENSQINLIKSIFISFSISMFYPVVISLIPGFLRILSLQNRKNDRKCIYDISKIISWI